MLEDSALRKQDFMKRFNEISKKYGNHQPQLTQTALVIKTIMSEAPSYYITYDYARRLLSLYRRGMLSKSYNPLRRSMIAEIAQRVDKSKTSLSSHAEGRALVKVLAGGNASRFFISLPTAEKIIHNL